MLRCGLAPWSSMAAWTRSRVVASRLVSGSATAVVAVWPRLRARPLTVGAASGNRLSCADAVALVSISSARASASRVPEEFPGTVGDWPQLDHALLGADDTALPLFHVDAQGLGEAPGDVEGQAETRKRGSG